ncbi:MAG TPA: 5-(carboxyamino)imidazole ribonucleotide synthase [Pseudogracilibacillus sp.]|nr:5-(carboxyamino)imidazole ribonucleotide synthase [Pseudogracilibacillus sp.]
MRNNKKSETIIPPQTIGIIGGGQLGRMMAIAAKTMGYNVIVLDPTENCPTAQVSDEHIVATYDDMDAIKQLTEKSDVVTYEFENVDLAAASFIEAAGKLPQGAFALEVTQNREREKTLMKDAGLPVAPFAIVKNGEDVKKALKHIPLPAVIKTCRGGYDGKGQLKITTDDDVQRAIEFADSGDTFILEQWIQFDQEISVVFTRATDGKITYFPLAENVHKEHILYETIAPARVSERVQKKAYEAAKVIAESLEVVGTFAIEMFVSGEIIFINEMAPRPHNSGHYTIESCNVSQFAQHIRAICQIPLVEIEQLKRARMINVLGENMEKALRALTEMPEANVHFYGKKEAKAKRKMGHVTFVANDEKTLEHYRLAYEEETK